MQFTSKILLRGKSFHKGIDGFSGMTCRVCLLSECTLVIATKLNHLPSFILQSPFFLGLGFKDFYLKDLNSFECPMVSAQHQFPFMFKLEFHLLEIIRSAFHSRFIFRETLVARLSMFEVVRRRSI